jgi:hypothetical protein
MASLAIAFATDQTVFSYIAVALILASLFTGGRWMRRKKRP